MTQLTAGKPGDYKTEIRRAIGAVLTVAFCASFGVWAREPYLGSGLRRQQNAQIERQVYAVQAKIQAATRLIDEEKSAHGAAIMLRMQHFVKPGEHLLVISQH
ncbi:MAG: hypothetical protein KGJ62_08670 [Armatimonadetes bacterium]|nr:hypothetical protein [Armatimonadota bacterium]MDE2205034.1 hypothetical protein [Armatimonadota bacterium]